MVEEYDEEAYDRDMEGRREWYAELDAELEDNTNERVEEPDADTEATPKTA